MSDLDLQDSALYIGLHILTRILKHVGPVDFEAEL